MISFEELWEKTIQSQYSNSPHIKGLVKKFANEINPNPEIEIFYDKVFNPLTARGKGLDIWGEIVGISRIIEADASHEYFGLLGQNMQNYNQAPFYYDSATNTFVLEDGAYRDLIFMKAFANISDATLPSIKRILNTILPNGTYVIRGGSPYYDIDKATTFGFNTDLQNYDNGSFASDQMVDGNKAYKLRIVFLDYQLPSYILAIFKQYGLLTKGAGVGWEYYIISPQETFGFDGSGMQNFNNGIFAPYDVIDGS